MAQANLDFLGVPPDDEEVYRLLLRKGHFRQSELGRKLSGDAVAQDDVVEIYHRLTEWGLAREAPSGQLAPISPAKAVEGLVERKVAEFRAELEAEASRRGVVDSLLADHEKSLTEAARTTDVSESIQYIEGMSAVRAVIDELTFFTRTESVTTNPNGVLTEESIAHARLLDTRVLRRGVYMRSIMGAAALDSPVTMNYVRELTALGAKIRISYQPLERLIICDRAAALTPIDPAQTAKGAILTRDPGLVAPLVALFERMWGTAQDLPAGEEREDADAAPITEFEQRILRSLATAEKDETGARDLGIAVRTYRKHVATIMRRLHATNRFQAALLARERGWI
ncbi:LuxR C-terminal-related transcriptional regulator [Streptomyces sp. DSM 44915]|uniref:LuxR C-terminal-related transcriptional regulator n=1 Tax=Streptomyces chisholmiae TaxID=3075540 RepID=A0ABU2JWT5_9ACTN|nr:LuxR C-terminal-related transcriptional regulator [Streptomyces sp. DSM 44915]MDT0269455.1 LuxR C-terminal-related transcriptional regulator [Streptomyces sp. DSM 44915]